MLFPLPPGTVVHTPPVAGAAAGQVIGVTQFQTCPAPPMGAFWQVHVVAPNGQRLAALPPGTEVQTAPCAGSAAGHTIGVTQFQAAPAAPAVHVHSEVG